MQKTVFNKVYERLEKHGDRIFIISMLALVMIIAFAFKKPENRKIEAGASFSNVSHKQHSSVQ